MNKLRYGAILLALLCHAGCSASQGNADPLSEYCNRKDMQGLYEIREVPRAHIAVENKKRHTKWKVLNPDI